MSEELKWWVVNGTVTVSAYTYVRAATAEAARDLARSRDPTLAQYGLSRSGRDPTEEAIVGEADGEFMPEDASEADDSDLKEIRKHAEDNDPDDATEDTAEGP